jgi:hypothetical protein
VKVGVPSHCERNPHYVKRELLCFFRQSLLDQEEFQSEWEVNKAQHLREMVDGMSKSLCVDFRIRVPVSRVAAQSKRPSCCHLVTSCEMSSLLDMTMVLRHLGSTEGSVEGGLVHRSMNK